MSDASGDDEFAIRVWHISHADLARFVTWVETGSLGVDSYVALVLSRCALPSVPAATMAVWRGFLRSLERGVLGRHDLGKLPGAAAGPCLGAWVRVWRCGVCVSPGRRARQPACWLLMEPVCWRACACPHMCGARGCGQRPWPASQHWARRLQTPGRRLPLRQLCVGQRGAGRQPQRPRPC
jgi:hypothetical protein